MDKKKKRRKKCSLHLHSWDKFDSADNAEDVCKREAELGATAVALTQHGVATQFEKFKKAAKKYGLKFIPGIEAYFRKGNEKRGLLHIILLAKNDDGWKTLCRAISQTQNTEGLCVMTEEDLWRYFGPGSEGHGNVVATTACISGIVADVLLTNWKRVKKAEKAKKEAPEDLVPEEELMRKAERAMGNLRDIFGAEDFYAEVQNHGIDKEAYVYPRIAMIARKLGVPIVATNDVHTVTNSPDELLKRRMLRSLRFETWSEDNVGDDQLYIKSDEELTAWLRKILPEDIVCEAMSNIDIVEDKCNVEFKVQNHYPKYSRDGDSEKVFDALIAEGIKRRFPKGLPAQYRERLRTEMSVIKKMGYVDYHLVVQDFLKYASKYDVIPLNRIHEAPIAPDALDRWITENGFTEKIGISTGPGRGSAAGSLVCELLGITNLDPIRYGLFFERFLNPERVSMPDIDSDISRTVRPLVIEYVKYRYGQDCVCGITTQTAQGPRGSVRIAAKCYGLWKNRQNKEDNGAKMFLSLADQIAKKIPSEPGISFKTVQNGETLRDALTKEYAGNNDAKQIISWASVFEGCFTTYGAHAAGIVITDGTPVCDIVPLRWNDALGIYTTQCDMVEVEENGMLKFDFLGLKTLDIINDVKWMLYKRGIRLDINEIPLDDTNVYRFILSSGKTDSVFQFESTGMKQMLRKFRPTCFEDLILLVAMFRPGPLQYLGGVIDVKNGRKEMSFLHPKLEPILGPTYGAIVYQEQVMQIFQQLAGYSLGQADLVRRAMSKKKMAVLEKERKAFVFGDPDRKDAHGNATPIMGCVNNGISAEIANRLFDQMMEFAKYAFNKSHAAVYALNAYITAYLKYYYPAEFLCAAMNWAEKTQKKDPIPGLMAEAKAMGIEVCAPDLNMSEAKFTTDSKRIVFGLSAVKSVGASADDILQERNANGTFTSFPDFYSRCMTKKNALENLIYAGAADGFTTNRQALVDLIPMYKKSFDKVREKTAFLEAAKEMLPLMDGLLTEEDIASKQRELGFEKRLGKLTTSKKLETRINNAKKALDEAQNEFDSLGVGTGSENMAARVEKEHELLGAYVTAHPMDEYQKLDIPPLSELSPETTTIYGVISAVDIKKRKKDGKPMAFITIEDRTGTVKANLFTACYAHEKEKIKKGNVVVLEGQIDEKVFYSGDDETTEERTYEMLVNKVYQVHPGAGYILAVSTYAAFHLYDETPFRSCFEEKYGKPFFIFDRGLNQIREARYRVSDTVSRINGITEYVPSRPSAG